MSIAGSITWLQPPDPHGSVVRVEDHLAAPVASGVFGHDPNRPRKLLLHRDEIDELVSQVMQKGLTLVPLRLYIKDGRAKIELALAVGKKLYDMRETIVRRSAEREMRRVLKSQGKR